MTRKGIVVLILLLIFSSVALETSFARNYPRAVDTQNEMHPWGGDDNNTIEIGDPDEFDPVAPVDYPLHYSYGSKADVIGGLFSALWQKLEYLVTHSSRSSSRGATSRGIGSGSPESTGVTHPGPGSGGGRVGR